MFLYIDETLQVFIFEKQKVIDPPCTYLGTVDTDEYDDLYHKIEKVAEGEYRVVDNPDIKSQSELLFQKQADYTSSETLKQRLGTSSKITALAKYVNAQLMKEKTSVYLSKGIVLRDGTALDTEAKILAYADAVLDDVADILSDKKKVREDFLQLKDQHEVLIEQKRIENINQLLS